MLNCFRFSLQLGIQGAMSVELPLVGDGELDKKIEEWLQWDKVLHIVSARLQFIRHFRIKVLHHVFSGFLHCVV
jgi:hypothetical protein